ncbi:hypothetical protein [Gordonia sp. (in: high G+C Gram-positive bacteria)]|uniref:Rv0361 family membrane protein n=1 Tax=Gordonia sp. (in: high G+C Gram-positive bacteria) TaxID=84139 RepID=UPI003C72C4A0
MSQDQPEVDEYGDDDDQPRSWKAALPMILAGSLMLALLAFVLIVALVNPPDERLNDSTLVQHRVNDMYSAMGTLNYDQYRNSFCQADIDSPDFPKSVAFADENRALNDAEGKVVVTKMDVEIVGTTSTVKSYWNREKTENNKQTTDLNLVKVGDDWKVCSR